MTKVLGKLGSYGDGGSPGLLTDCGSGSGGPDAFQETGNEQREARLLGGK